jgi:hypothetical protein
MSLTPAPLVAFDLAQDEILGDAPAAAGGGGVDAQ